MLNLGLIVTNYFINRIIYVIYFTHFSPDRSQKVLFNKDLDLLLRKVPRRSQNSALSALSALFGSVENFGEKVRPGPCREGEAGRFASHEKLDRYFTRR